MKWYEIHNKSKEMRYHFYTFVKDDDLEISKIKDFLETLDSKEYVVKTFLTSHRYYCFETNNVQFATLFKLTFC